MQVDKIRNPIIFQGNIKKRNYFEGWYYKISAMENGRVASFIPGISLNDGDAHCFVQYIFVTENENGTKKTESGYIRFTLDAFKFQDSPFLLQIGENSFAQSKIHISMTDKNLKNGTEINIKADFELGELTKIRMKLAMPNIMGFFAYFPMMECYHGIVSMSHSAHGTLKINESEIEIKNGRGYIEKDWGTSFPKKYIWIQCNNFNDAGTSIFCSVADIPFLGMSFLGFICNFIHEGKEYRFATYNNSNLKIESVSSEKIVLVFENVEAKLKIEAYIGYVAELIAPKSGKMQDIIKEEVSGETKIFFLDKKSGDIYDDFGYMAGIENKGF